MCRKATARASSFDRGSRAADREAQIDRFKANDFAILRAGIVETPPKFVPRGLCRFHALESLLKIALTGAAARVARFYVEKQLFMVGDILVRKRDEAQKTYDIDVGFRRVERDQFGALEHPKAAASTRADCRQISWIDAKPSNTICRTKIDTSLPFSQTPFSLGGNLTFWVNFSGPRLDPSLTWGNSVPCVWRSSLSVARRFAAASPTPGFVKTACEIA